MATGKETAKQAADRVKATKAIEASEKRIAQLVAQSGKASGEALQQIEKSVKAEEKKISLLDKELSRLDSIKSMYDDIASNLQSSTKLIKAAAKAQENMFKATVSVADVEEQILENEEKLKNAKLDGRKLEVRALKLAQQKLKVDRAALKGIKHMADGAGALNDELQGSVKEIQDFVGKLPGGGMISKMMGLDKLGEGVEKGLTSAVTAFSKTGSLGAGVAAFSKGLMAALNPITLIAAAVFGLVMVFKEVSKQAHAISDATGMTYGQSKLLVKEANKQVGSFGNQLSLQEDILAVQKEQIAQLGAVGQLTGKQAGAVSDIGKAFGYGAEQAGKVNAAFMSMGVSADSAANAQRELAAEALKSGVNVGAVTADIAENAASTAKFFGGNVKALKKAAIEAAKMGVSLATMVKVSESLLNFEESISSQFELQALTGKQMNFDLARQLALEGDIAGATKAVMDQVGSIHDFNKMDVLERKKLAEATGMDVNELQKSLTIKDKMGDLTADELASMNALGLSAAEIANMSAKDLQTKLAQQQSSEKMSASFAAMKAQLVNALMPAAEAFMGIFAALSPILKVVGMTFKLIGAAIKGFLAPITFVFSIITSIKDAIAGVLDTFGFLKPVVSALGIAFDVIKNSIMVAGAILGTVFLPNIIAAGGAALVAAGGFIAKAIGGIFGSFAAIPFGIGIPLAIAAVGGLMTMVSKAKSVGDLGIDPNGGPIVSSPTVGGIFQGDKRDGVSMGPGMGTNPSAGGAGVVNNYYGENESNGISMQDVVDALGNITINMDGKALAAEIRVADSFRRG